MKKKYIKPETKVVKIPSDWCEGMMQSWSTGTGSGSGPGQGAKPNPGSDTWGNVWDVQNANHTWGEDPTANTNSGVDISGLTIK